MSSYPMEYGYDVPASQAPADARAAFIRNTYAHLAGAILAFIGIEAGLLMIPGLDEPLVRFMFQSNFSWLLVIGAFMVVSWVARSWANSETSITTQYMGLGLYVVAESVIFLPLLYIASRFYPNAIPTAGILTTMVVVGLTACVFMSGRDFSFLAPALSVGGFLMLGLIVAMAIFGFHPGIFVAFFGVALASGYIIYDTSNVIHRFRTTQYVAASLELFASVALLFWYILQIVMSSSRRD